MTQFGNECFCGASDDLEVYEVNGPGVCHMSCYGDDSIACGGRWGFSLYKYGVDAPSMSEVPTPAPVVPAPTPKPVRYAYQ